jgi:hypothetical protein
MQFVNFEEIRLGSSESAQFSPDIAVQLRWYRNSCGLARERDLFPGGCRYVSEDFCRLDPVVNVAS